MRVTGLEAIVFKHRSRIVHDAEGHAHPGPEHDATQSLTRVLTDEGVEGYCFGGDKDAYRVAVEPILVGENPWDREKIWQRLWRGQRIYRHLLSDSLIGVVDMALWDLQGRYVGLPVSKLLGGYREKVKAYASTMCGDDIPGGLDTPEAYADFAEACKKRGYGAFKLHTWMYPLGPSPERDMAACRAVREHVGPDMALMLDCSHDYTREEALYIGRELEKLGFYWFEEPMNEYSISSYVWLADQLSIPVVGPEVAEGRVQTRAEWIQRGASDISRYGTDLGGITAAMKAVHLCEAFGVRLELHGGGPGNLQVLGTMGIPGEYYERGLLHPMLDYERGTPWLKTTIDPMDSEGYVPIPQKPGLGMEVNWDFIQENLVEGRLP